jgi:hypothetical protein
MLHPSLLKGNLLLRLRAQRGYERGYTHITAEGESLDNWSGENPRSPKWPPSWNDGSTKPYRIELSIASSLGPVDPKASLDALDEIGRPQEV